tara:strand:+ start:61 stop:270 length:210 start_codon:yes stop_codon:yes gene_type:complete
MAKKQINEIDLDRLFKLTLTGFFGSKILDKAAQRAALKDPKIKNDIKDLHSKMKDINSRLKDLQAKNKI